MAERKRTPTYDEIKKIKENEQNGKRKRTPTYDELKGIKKVEEEEVETPTPAPAPVAVEPPKPRREGGALQFFNELGNNMQPFRNFVDSATFGLPNALDPLLYKMTGSPQYLPPAERYRPDSEKAIAFTERDPKNPALKWAKDTVVDPLSLTFRNPDRLGEFGGYFVPGVAIEQAFVKGMQPLLKNAPKFLQSKTVPNTLNAAGRMAQRGITGSAAGLTDATLQEVGDVAFRGQPFDPENAYLGAALGGGLNIGLGAAGDAIAAGARGLRRTPPAQTQTTAPQNPTAPTIENASRVRAIRGQTPTGAPVIATKTKRSLDDILNDKPPETQQTQTQQPETQQPQSQPQTQQTVPPESQQAPPNTQQPTPQTQTPPVQTNTQAPNTRVQRPVNQDRVNQSRKKVQTSSGQSIDIEYELREADDVITSNDPMTLKKNDNYDQSLQPRDRDKSTYELQIQDILNPNKFNPDRLGDAPTTDVGAPIVFDSFIESGNGRTMALKRGYTINHPSMEVYRNYLRDNAAQFGFTPDQVASMQNPILVRVRKTDLSEQQRGAYVKESNESTSAALGATEQARLDSQYIDESIIDLLDTEGNIDFTSQKNNDFVSQFLRKVVSPNELNQYIDKQNQINQAGINRIRNAIFAKAYQNDAAIARLVESTDDNVRNISQSLLSFAPRLMKLKKDIQNGSVFDVDLSDDLVRALVEYSDIRKNKQTVEYYLNQGSILDDTDDIVKSLLILFDEYKLKKNRLTKVFNNVADALEDYGDPNQMTLFGDNTAPTKIELLEEALKNERKGQSPDGEDDLFTVRTGETSGDGNTGEPPPKTTEQPEPESKPTEPVSKPTEPNNQKVEELFTNLKDKLKLTDRQIDFLKNVPEENLLKAKFIKNKNGLLYVLWRGGKEKGTEETLTLFRDGYTDTGLWTIKDKDTIFNRTRIILPDQANNKEFTRTGNPILTKDELIYMDEPAEPTTTTKDVESDEYLFSEQRRNDIREEVNKMYEKKIKDVKETMKKSGVNSKEFMEKYLKGMGYQKAAEIRERIQGDLLIPIEGGLTGKELDVKIKYLESNYEGKEVFVGDREGVIEKTVFGNVIIKFKDGSKLSYDYETLKKLNFRPKVDLEQVIREQTERQAKYTTVDETPKNTKPDPKPDTFVNRMLDNLDNLENQLDDFLKNSRNRLSSNPSDIYAAMAAKMAIKVVKGTIKLADFTAELIKEFGEEVRPYAQQIFKQTEEIVSKYQDAMRERQANNQTPLKKETPKVTSTARQLPKGGKLLYASANLKDGMKERKFITTLKDSEKPPQQFKEKLDSTYRPVGNQETLDKANQRINEDIEKANSYVLGDSEYTAEKAATAQRLIDIYNSEGKFERAVDVAMKIAEEATNAGRAIQALSMFDRLTPEGTLIRITRIANKANESLPKGTKPFVVTPETTKNIIDLVQSSQNATGIRELAKTFEDIVRLAKEGKKLEPQEAEMLIKFVNDARKFAEEAKTAVGQAKKALQEANQQKPTKATQPKPPQPEKAERSNRPRVRDAVKTFAQSQVEAARQRLKDRGVQISSTPLDVYADYAIIGAGKIAEGTVDFIDWSEAMIKEIGENMRPHLESLFERSKQVNSEWEKEIEKTVDDPVMKLVNKLIKENELTDAEADKLIEYAARISKLSGEEKRLVSQDLQVIAQQFDVPTLGRKLASAQTIAMLLNPKTIGRNAIGNELFYRVERINKYLATPIDMINSKLTGKQRTITFKTNNQAEYWKNWMVGWKAGMKGVNVAGLETQFDLRGPAFKSKANPLMYLERVLGATLRSFDYAGYMRAYNDTLGELATLRAMSEGKGSNKDLIQRYIRESDENILEIADQYGKYVTFQDNNAISNALVSLKRGLNFKKDFGLGDVILKFPRTPGALLMRALEYSPAGFIRSAYLLAKAMKKKEPNTREIINALSRAIHGTIGLSLMGYFMMMNGIITGAGTKDRDIRDLERAAGTGKYQVNLTSLMRFVKSGFNPKEAGLREGDLLYSYDWAQPVAIAVSLGANIRKAQEEKEGDLGKTAEDLFDTAYSSLDGAISTLTEQSVLQGLKRFTEGYPDQSVLDKLVSTAADIPPSFVPTIFNQLRQMADPYSRETYDPNIAKQSLNRVVNRIPGLSRTLPQQYSALGEERKPYQQNSVFNVMVNPGFASRYKLSDEARYVLSLIEETKDEQLAPRVPSRSYQGIKFTNEEFALLQKYQGEKTRELIAKNLQKDRNKRLEVQAKNVSKSLDKAGDYARSKILKEMVNPRLEESK